MNDPQNPVAGLPLHHIQFLAVRDGGGPQKVAHGVAELHGLTLEELKANCRRAAEELIQERGALLEYEQPVYDWARS